MILVNTYTLSRYINSKKDGVSLVFFAVVPISRVLSTVLQRKCGHLSRLYVAIQAPATRAVKRHTLHSGNISTDGAYRRVLLRIGFTFASCYHNAGELLPRLSILTERMLGGLFLLHFPESYLWRTLSVILCPRSPDFPHGNTFRQHAARSHRTARYLYHDFCFLSSGRCVFVRCCFWYILHKYVFKNLFAMHNICIRSYKIYNKLL